MENTRALVRPIMAYSSMALFIAVEVTAFITLVDAGLGAGDALNQIGMIALWRSGPVS